MVALLLANSPLSAAFHSFWETPIGVSLGDFKLIEPLHMWINDGLMTLFFFIVGLEIKRELVSGELTDPRKALLPIVAALGGMVVPAAVYALFLWGRPGWRGWGVPMATDIAFVVGFLTLFGSRAPNGLKILLLTLAIADDIGAVLVIAVVYSGQIAAEPLALAGIGLCLVPFLRWIGVRSVIVYSILGVGLWLAFLESGVHPTVAGVILGLLTPARPMLGRGILLDVVGDLYDRLWGIQRGTPQGATEVTSPAERLERHLHPWVAFLIMPVFALANAGVEVHAQELTTPVAIAVAAGLVLGKPLGIVLFALASVRLGWARLPEGVDRKVMLGAGCLGGIGFTIQLFGQTREFKMGCACRHNRERGFEIALRLAPQLATQAQPAQGQQQQEQRQQAPHARLLARTVLALRCQMMRRPFSVRSRRESPIFRTPVVSRMTLKRSDQAISPTGLPSASLMLKPKSTSGFGVPSGSLTRKYAARFARMRSRTSFPEKPCLRKRRAATSMV